MTALKPPRAARRVRNRTPRIRLIVGAIAAIVVMALLVVVVGLVTSNPAPAGATAIRDPAGHRLSCPDPSVLNAHVGAYRYYLVCTSDRARNALPIRGSNDMVHWHLISYVFPAARDPWWAQPPPKGRYWGPALYRIDGRWVVYFSAPYNPKRVYIGDGGAMVIGVATAISLTGPWHTELLHYRGQFNAVDREQETYGGVIDPSMVRDPATGRRYLFWAEQPRSIWVARLSSNGLVLDSQVHQVLGASERWECTPTCVIEGPEVVLRRGTFYLLYSGAGTWSGTYAVGAALSRNPMVGTFTPLPGNPIIKSGHGYVGTGGSSAFIRGPNGKTYVFYHYEVGVNVHHQSDLRYLMVSPVRWTGRRGTVPVVVLSHAR